MKFYRVLMIIAVFVVSYPIIGIGFGVGNRLQEDERLRLARAAYDAAITEVFNLGDVPEGSPEYPKRKAAEEKAERLRVEMNKIAEESRK